MRNQEKIKVLLNSLDGKNEEQWTQKLSTYAAAKMKSRNTLYEIR